MSAPANAAAGATMAAHAAVVARERQRRQALLAGDVPTLAAMCDDQLFYRHASSKLDDKQTFLASFKGMDYHEILVKSEQVTVSGATAVVNLVEKIVVRSKGSTEDRISHVLALNVWTRDASGAWQLLARQANYDPAYPR